MYRDLEILRDKNGRPISQYLDVIDQKFKPITKDNYPELQKVKDDDVKTELESIKQTQSEILERLDGTFDAQLSGSNVVLPFKTITPSIQGKTIPAGSSLTATLDIGGYRKALMSIGYGKPVDVTVTFANTLGGIWAGSIVKNAKTTTNSISGFEPIGNTQAILVVNNDDKEVTVIRARVVAQ